MPILMAYPQDQYQIGGGLSLGTVADQLFEEAVKLHFFENPEQLI